MSTSICYSILTHNFMNQPVFSIVIPLFNKEKYIGRTIDSILSQKFGNFEIIIVNDGSTDSSLSIVSQYTDKRIRIINKPNEGVSATRNRGMSEAKGELVCFLDADDVLLPNALVEFMRLRKTKNCDIYAASFVEKTPSDCISKNAICTNGFFKNALKAICFHKITARMGNIVIKRDVLQSVGAMRTDITLYEDKEWLLRLFRGREVLASNYVVMEYRRNNNGLSKAHCPIERDLAGNVSLAKIHDKYERIILADFLFRRIVRMLQARDNHGVCNILKQNMCFLPFLVLSTCIRLIPYKWIKI